MSNAIEQAKKAPLRQVQNVKHLLYNDEAKGQLSAVAAKHMNPERMMRVTANAIRTTPKLQECDPMSFLGALMQCASLGLEPNTVLGHAYMIPFKNNKKGITEVQVVIGYKGLIDLARRSGHITSISANIHYSDDELWEYEEGTEARLRHRPGSQDGEKLHAYAIAKFTDGGHAYVVLPWRQIMKIRDGSQGWQTAVRFNSTAKSPWATHEDAMAKKTAIRALAKYLPLSVEFMDAVQVDHDGGGHADFAKFAMQPDEGVTIDGEYSESETSDDVDEAGEKPSEDEDKADTSTNEKPKAKAETTKEPEKQASKSKDDKPKPDLEQFSALKDTILNDLQDAADTSDVMELYQDQIDQMEQSAPEIYQELMDEFEAFNKGGDQ